MPLASTDTLRSRYLRCAARPCHQRPHQRPNTYCVWLWSGQGQTTHVAIARLSLNPRRDPRRTPEGVRDLPYLRLITAVNKQAALRLYRALLPHTVWERCGSLATITPEEEAR